MTIKGICYVFNLQNHRLIFNQDISKNFDSYGISEEHQGIQWSLDQGYISNNKNMHPVRASNNGGLEVTMKIEGDEKGMGLFGYSITLPNEILTHTMLQNNLQWDTQRFIKLSAKSTQMGENLRNFSPVNRGCYFQDERKLQFFSSYTRSNCMLECLTNLTLETCNCVTFLLPHNNSTKICSSEYEAECNRNVLVSFPPAKYIINPCDCLPTCNNIEYSWTEEQKSVTQILEK
jgi:acid-sensing ion channel, other